MKTRLCSSVRGRWNAAVTNRLQKASIFVIRLVSSGLLPASRSRLLATRFATSIAAEVAASSQALETDTPRSYPRLLSSGGKAVATTRVGVEDEGERFRAGISCCAPCGGFHCNEMDAVSSLNLK